MAGAAVNHVIGLLLIIIDFALYILTLGPLITLFRALTARTVFAKPHSEVPINGNLPPSKVWRSVEAIADGKLEDGIEFFDGATTAYEVLCSSYEKYATLKAQGTRTLLENKVDQGFKFPTKYFGPTVWRTYAEMGQAAHAFGAGLRKLGVEPQPADAMSVDHKGALIYDDTSADWMVAAQGCISQDIVVATAYATLGAEAVVKAVKQGGVTVLVCNRKAVPNLLKMVKDMPTLKAIVYTDSHCTVEETTNKLTGSSKPAIISFAEVIELGKANPTSPTKPKPDSLAVLMYTSGSTGDPKGVMIQHKQLVAQMASVQRQFSQLFGPPGAELYLGYLPLAHILELVAEFFYFSAGNAIGYADPKSLLPGPEKCQPNGGLDEFGPTLMAGVPKVWESIKAGALAKVKAAGATAEFLIALAVKMKSTAKKQHRYTPLFNVLLKKFKKTTGGNLKACLSGGGAISGEVQEWVRTALDCPLVQGYGLTETCAGTTIQMPDDMSLGIAGTPISSMEVTLHSEPEFTDANGNPYLTTDTVHSNGDACSGRGEVWIRGTNLSAGYYKMPELTKTEFGADGFFHSGDIGLLTPGGALKIVDRKKNLVKLKGGEYVALEKMNTAYNNSSFVNVDTGGVCCYADDSLDRAVAIAQCKVQELQAVAKELGIVGSNKELAANPQVQGKVVESFKACAKAAGLTSLETVVGVYPIVEDDWTPANGCLTATQKLVPRTVQAHNAKELAEIKKKGAR